MRTLSDTLKSAQQAYSKNTLYKIVLTKGASSYTYDKERISPEKEISKHDEEMYSQVATIVLHNRDHELDDINLKGYEAVISYGIITTAGEEYSATAPLSVIDQQFDSDPNNLTCTLLLQGTPNLMAEDEASESYIPASDDTKSVKELINAIAGATLAPFTHCKAFEVVWDAGYDPLADSYKPKDGFRIYERGKRLAAFRRVLDYTGNVPRFEADGKIHILKPVTTGETYNSEYSLARNSHTFFKKAYRETLVIPNRFVVKSLPDDSPAYEGSAQVSDYASLLDSVKKTQFVRVKLESDDQGDDIAAALLSKAETGCARGSAEVPLNCGSEVFDYVKVTDSRQGDSRTGNLGYVHRRFGGDNWKMTFGFGNWLESLRYQAVLKGLENYTDVGQSFARLSVGDLYVEHILADNIDLVWIDPDGTIDLSKIGDTLDNLPDGETYARTKSMHLDASGVYLEENVLYSLRIPEQADKNLTKGTTAPTDKAIGDIWVDTNYTPNEVKMWSGSSWAELTAEQLAEFNRGSIFRRVKTTSLTADGLVLLDQVQVGTYGLIKAASLSAEGLVLLDQTVEGTYGKILKTDLTAYHVKGTAIVQSSSARLVTDSEKSDWNEAYGLALDAYDLAIEVEDDMVAGKLTLSAYTNIEGTWYNTGGVEISGSSGIAIKGEALKYKRGSTTTGVIYAQTTSPYALIIYTLGSSPISIQSSEYIYLNAQSGYDDVIVQAAYLRPSSGGVHLGSNSYKWADIYVTTVYEGDTVFANNWKLTETPDNKGMMLLRPDGSIAQEWR